MSSLASCVTCFNVRGTAFDERLIARRRAKMADERIWIMFGSVGDVVESVEREARARSWSRRLLRRVSGKTSEGSRVEMLSDGATAMVR